MDQKKERLFLAQQKAEITEYHVYTRLSEFSKDEKNKEILKKIVDAALAAL